MSYSRLYKNKANLENISAPAEEYKNVMVQNDAGGYVFEASQTVWLRRFLLLGTTNSTIYVNAEDRTKEAGAKLIQLIHANGVEVVREIVAVNSNDDNAVAAYKKDASIFALAMAWLHGDNGTRIAVTIAINGKKVISNMSQLMQFLNDIRTISGKATVSSRLQRAISDWMHRFDDKSLMTQFVKYQNRNGWTTRDVLRVSHVKPFSQTEKDVFLFATKGEYGENEYLMAFNLLQTTESLHDVITLIKTYGFTWEMVPSKWRSAKEEYAVIVWRVLLGLDGATMQMPYTALIRNLRPMQNAGVFNAQDAVDFVVEKITNQKALINARVHPFAAYASYMGYKKGDRNGNNEVNDEILSALNQAFYLSFDVIPETNKKLAIWIDVSGSMSSQTMEKLDITASHFSAILGMVLARKAPNAVIRYFDTQERLVNSGRNNSGIKKLEHAKTFEEAIAFIEHFSGGGTDCGVPMATVTRENKFVDAMVIITDNESWYGDHPYQQLKAYRKSVNPNMKMAYCAVTANNSSLREPDDDLTLDIVGMDTNMPRFVVGWISE